MSKPKIFALIAFRDEEQDLPGFFSHLEHYVDGFIAFDDCSLDNSRKIAQKVPKMIQLLERQVPSADHFFEVQNRKTLLKAARAHGADWVLCGDADERFETRFLTELPDLIKNPPAQVMGLRLAAVWENIYQYRVGQARKLVLFPSVDPEPYHAEGRLHQEWFPPRFYEKSKVILDYRLYHLGSMTRLHRTARYEKFNRIDPRRIHQPQGYGHLINESNVEVARISPDRAFRYA